MLTGTLKGKKILVTGGAGFLGHHLLPQLLEAGAEISCLIRSPAAAANLPAKVIPVLGDCTNLSQMQKAMAGQDVLIHMAAALFGGSWTDYLEPNSTIADNIASSLENSGIRQIVHISSLAAAGPCGTRPGRDETMPAQPVSAYGWSKLLSEKLLENAVFRLTSRPRLTVLRPPIIYGSRDNGLLPLFKSCRHGIGVSPGLRKFPVSIIHANDAANAIVLALLHPQAEGIFHLSDGEEYTMDDLCRAMGKAQGRKNTIVLKPPLLLMGAAAALAGWAYGAQKMLCRLARFRPPRPPRFNPDKWRESAQIGWLANNARSVRVLGFKPRYNLDSGMAEAVAGYRQAGIL